MLRVVVALVLAVCKVNAFVLPNTLTTIKHEEAIKATPFLTKDLKSKSNSALNAMELAALDFDLSGNTAIGIGVVAAIAFLAIGGIEEETSSTPEETEPEPEPIDVSIPYDAAARLAYDEWRAENEVEEFEQESFDKFKKLYVELAVAEVVLKKKSRDMDKF